MIGEFYGASDRGRWERQKDKGGRPPLFHLVGLEKFCLQKFLQFGARREQRKLVCFAEPPPESLKRKSGGNPCQTLRPVPLRQKNANTNARCLQKTQT